MPRALIRPNSAGAGASGRGGPAGGLTARRPIAAGAEPGAGAAARTCRGCADCARAGQAERAQSAGGGRARTDVPSAAPPAPSRAATGPRRRPPWCHGSSPGWWCKWPSPPPLRAPSCPAPAARPCCAGPGAWLLIPRAAKFSRYSSCPGRRGPAGARVPACRVAAAEAGAAGLRGCALPRPSRFVPRGQTGRGPEGRAAVTHTFLGEMPGSMGTRPGATLLSGGGDRQSPDARGALPGGSARRRWGDGGGAPGGRKILLFRFLRSTAANAGGTQEDGCESWGRHLRPPGLISVAVGGRRGRRLQECSGSLQVTDGPQGGSTDTSGRRRAESSGVRPVKSLGMGVGDVFILTFPAGGRRDVPPAQSSQGWHGPGVAEGHGPRLFFV